MSKPPHPPKPGTSEWCIEHPNSNHPDCDCNISVPIESIGFAIYISILISLVVAFKMFNKRKKTPNQLVNAYAKLMKKELKDNSHKGDWREWKNVQEISQELTYHISKLQIALENENEERIREHSADCSNFLMMIVNAKSKL